MVVPKDGDEEFVGVLLSKVLLRKFVVVGELLLPLEEVCSGICAKILSSS